MKRPPLRWSDRLEFLLAIPMVIATIHAIWYLRSYGYLPQPYFYEPSDTFGDFFSPALYAHWKGAFDFYRTIYPPLTFALLKFITWAPCYTGTGFESARACDAYAISWIVAFYFFDLALIALTFFKLDRRTALPRTMALGMGLPLTFTLERGNLLLVCFACAALAYGPLIRSARLRWVLAGLAVNFKVYLISTVFAQLLRRRWRWFEGALLATVLVYCVSYVILGAGSPLQLYENITDYSTGYVGSSVLDLWYPSSMRPLLDVLSGDSFPVSTFVDSQAADLAVVLAVAIKFTTVGAILAACAATSWRPQVVPMHRLVALAIGLSTIMTEVGGYIHLLLIFFVLMEPWRGIGRPVALVLAYLACANWDIPLGQIPPHVVDSFLGGREVFAEYPVGLIALLRPLFIHGLLASLSVVTLRDVWADARAAGWGAPWDTLMGRHRTLPASTPAE